MLKFTMKVCLGAMAIMLVYFMIAAATGRTCLACGYDPAMQVNFFNPSAADVEMMKLLLTLVCLYPFMALAFFGLVLLGIRVTASAENIAAAKEARAMGEEGVGTALFLEKLD